MTTDPYRGDSARLAAFDQEIARLERALTTVFWERVAPVWRIAPPGTPITGDALEARRRRVSLLHDVIRHIQTGTLAAAELGPAPERRPGGAFDAALDEPDVVRTLERLAAVSPGSEVIRRGQYCWGIRVRAEDVPIDASVYRVPTRGAARWQWAFGTTAAPSAHLRLRPEGILQDVLEMFGLGQEIELGDQAFDPAFVVEGDEPSARTILRHDVRGDLLALSARGITTLTVARGSVMLEVQDALGPASLLFALRVLRAIHCAPSPFALLTPSSE